MASSYERNPRLTTGQRMACARFVAAGYFENPMPTQVWYSSHYGTKSLQHRSSRSLPDCGAAYSGADGLRKFQREWQQFCTALEHPSHKLRAILDGVLYLASLVTRASVDDLRSEALTFFDADETRCDLDTVLQTEFPPGELPSLGAWDSPRLCFAAEGSATLGLPDLVARVVRSYTAAGRLDELLAPDEKRDLRTLNGFTRIWLESCLLSSDQEQQLVELQEQQLVELVEGATYLTAAYARLRGKASALCGRLKRRVHGAMPCFGHYLSLVQVSAAVGFDLLQAFLDSDAPFARLYVPPQRLAARVPGLLAMVIAVRDQFQASLSKLLDRLDDARGVADADRRRRSWELEWCLGRGLMDRVRKTNLPCARAVMWDYQQARVVENGDSVVKRYVVVKVLFRDPTVMMHTMWTPANDTMPYWF